MNKYKIGKEEADSVELKCLLINRGVTVDNEVFARFGGRCRLHRNPETCNSFRLSDGTNVQLNDMETDSDFRLGIADDRPALFHGDEQLDFVSFERKTRFYEQRTSSGRPFLGNVVLQGCDFVSFPCIWSCEYAAAGCPCSFCFAGAEFERRAKAGERMPDALSATDVAETVRYAVEHKDATGIQITGGSTFGGETEHRHIVACLRAIADMKLGLEGETLLYLTPPKHSEYLDEYFSLGADRIACSLEVWDEELAKLVTPGKIRFTSRARHLSALEYIAKRYGRNRAFSNFVIGLERFETLKEGATYLARRGIIPSASVWMPGRRIPDGITRPSLDYFRRVKDMLAALYYRYMLSPAGGCGLNVCIEKDILRLVVGG